MYAGTYIYVLVNMHKHICICIYTYVTHVMRLTYCLIYETHKVYTLKTLSMTSGGIKQVVFGKSLCSNAWGQAQEVAQGSWLIRSRDGDLPVHCRLPRTLGKWVARSKPETLVRAIGMYRHVLLAIAARHYFRVSTTTALGCWRHKQARHLFLLGCFA